jgi:hypothetical protein
VKRIRQRAASSVRRRIFLALLGALLLLAVTAYALAAPGAKPAAQKTDFSISASPNNASVDQGDSTNYTVTIKRLGGFGGPVSLSVTGLPSGATATWSPSSTIPGSSSTATLVVQTVPSTPTGSNKLNITGTGTPGSHSTQVGLGVQKAKTVGITGAFSGSLSPGATAPMNLTFTNPYSWDVNLTNLTVTLRPATSRAGCSGSQNFQVTQFSGSYPLLLHPGSTQLSSLVADSSKWPKVSMHNLSTNQDACKGASVSFDYGGSVTK